MEMKQELQQLRNVEKMINDTKDAITALQQANKEREKTKEALKDFIHRQMDERNIGEYNLSFVTVKEKNRRESNKLSILKQI